MFGPSEVAFEHGDPTTERPEFGLLVAEAPHGTGEVGLGGRHGRDVEGSGGGATLGGGRLLHESSVPIGPRAGSRTYTRCMSSSPSPERPGSPAVATRRALRRPSAWLALVAAGLVLGAHLIGTPRNAGPDEASHQVASAALVRGERTGTPVPRSRTVVTFEVPSMAGSPNPACFAFQPDVPVTCNNSVRLSTSSHPMGTTSQHYPPLGLLLPGLASYAPWAGAYAYVARLLTAAVPFLLLAAALRRAHAASALVRAGLVVGLTPIAWFTMSITNPSGSAIAGGVAIWASLALPRRDAVRGDWLFVAGWAALAASRRDGPLWATMVVLAAALVTSTHPADLWRRATQAQRIVAVVAWLATVVAVRTDTGSPFPLLLALAPLALVLVHLLTPWTTAQLAAGPRGRALVGALAALIAAIAGAAVVALSDRLSGTYLLTVVQSSGEHLVQVVGRLGTLDASAPMSSVVLWWVGFGALLGAALTVSPRRAATVIALVLGVVALAWALEIGSGNRSGSYWQARYSLPLLAGLPLALATTASRSTERRGHAALSGALGATTWWVWNTTFVAAQRRWAVGAHGSLSPFAWDTWGAPVHPALTVVVHALASAVLVLWACAATVPTRAST